MVATDDSGVAASPKRRGRSRPRNPTGDMTLLEHLRDFQKRLFRAVIAIVAGAAIAWMYYDQIFALIQAPFNAVVEEARAEGKEITLAISGVTEAFTLQLEVVLVVGVIISAPFWLYQLWRFLAPGLTGKERRWAYVFAFSATPLFLLGAALAYVAMPTLLRVFLGFTPQNVANIINVNDYLSFTLQLMLFFGIGAVIPVVFVMLNFAGLLTGKALLKQWRWLVIGVLVFSAVATPTPDPVNMGLAATPFASILVVSIGIMLLNDARRARRRRRDPLAALSDDEASPTPEVIVDVEDLRPSRLDDDA